MQQQILIDINGEYALFYPVPDPSLFIWHTACLFKMKIGTQPHANSFLRKEKKHDNGRIGTNNG